MRSLVGTWELESVENYPDGGEPYFPLGKDPVGMLLYTADGFVSATMAKRNRPVFKGPVGTDAEKAEAFDTIYTYYGRYEFLGDRVIHTVGVSNVPTLTGATVERAVEFDEQGRLTLRLGRYLAPDGRTGMSKVVWRR